MLCNVLVYNIPILTYIIILTFIFLDGYMYVCIHFMYVCMIINYCTWIHICGGCRAAPVSRADRERLPFSSTWFHPPIIIQFDLFSDGPLNCLCTISLTDLVHSYLELRDWTMDLAASTCSYITSTGQNICINIHNLWWY